MNLVSIITPTHNCSQYIRQTIDSVLSQTYHNFELIIIDDNSDDDTVEIVKTYNDSRIILLCNVSNKGAAYSRNIGLKKANGDYIAFLDGDDTWNNNKLEKQINFMLSNNYSFSYTNYSVINENGTTKNYYITGPKKVTHRMFKRSDYVGCLTVMFKKDLYPDLQIPDTIIKRNDYALWIKISERSNCYLLDECLAYYRINSGGLSKTRKSKLFKHHIYMFKTLLGYNKFHAFWCSLVNVWFLFVRRIKYKKAIKKESK